MCGQVLFAGHVSTAAIFIHLLLAVIVLCTDFSDIRPSTRTTMEPTELMVRSNVANDNMHEGSTGISETNNDANGK